MDLFFNLMDYIWIMDAKTIISALRTEFVAGHHTPCKPNWANHGKAHFSDPFSRLYWIKSGQGAVIYPDHTVTLEPGKLFIFPAFKAARYLCPKEMDLYWIHFKAQLFGSLEIFDLLEWKTVVPAPHNEDMVEIFKQFFDAMYADDTPKYFAADGLLRRILGLFATDASHQNERLQNLQRFMPAISYIEQNLHRSISLKELTKIVPLQYAYFCDLFSKTMGQSPIDYINYKRIERAQFLMSQEKKPLKEIAASVGFQDVYYFSRVFKKIVGIAPAHYRKQEQLRS